MLKSVSAGIIVRVASKVRQNEQSRIARVLWLVLNGLPQLSTQPVGTTDAVNVQRISSSVGDIDVVHGYPQKAGSLLPHQSARDIYREFVGTRQRQRMRFKVIHRKFQHHL